MPCKNTLSQRHHLLTQKNAEQADERNDWRRWRAHVEHAVDDANEQASGQCYEVGLHELSFNDKGGGRRLGGDERCQATSDYTPERRASEAGLGAAVSPCAPRWGALWTMVYA